MKIEIQDVQEIQDKIRALQEELEERKRALPRHTIQPHQIMAIEELEDQIRELQELRILLFKPKGNKE